MKQVDLELKTLFYEMLEGVEDLARKYETTRIDLEKLKLKVQWSVGIFKGYQIFDYGEYSYEIDGELPDPDLVVTFKDLGMAKKLFKDELRDYRIMADGKKFRIHFYEIEENMNIIEPKVPYEDFKYDVELQFSGPMEQRKLYFLSRIPAFNKMFVKFYDPEHSTGTPIPINVSLGTYENQIIPMVVLEHFFKRASLMYLVDCGCRLGNECKDYDARLGCMYLGKGVAKLDLTLPWRIEKHGHLASYDEAMAQARKAIESGLVPVMGRYRAEAAMMYALPDEGDMLTICYCCPCCCIQGGVKHRSSAVRKIFKRMEGVNVQVDEELCVGCEDCLEVCIYDGINITEGKAQVNQETCLGCGRCERMCQNDAITINIDDYNQIDDLIARIESYVNVT